MKTAEEILKEHSPFGTMQVSNPLVIKAMEEYAQQQAIEFLEWVDKNRYEKFWGGDLPNLHKWYIPYTPPSREYLTTNELYDKWKNSKK